MLLVLLILRISVCCNDINLCENLSLTFVLFCHRNLPEDMPGQNSTLNISSHLICLQICPLFLYVDIYIYINNFKISTDSYFSGGGKTGKIGVVYSDVFTLVIMPSSLKLSNSFFFYFWLLASINAAHVWLYFDETLSLRESVAVMPFTSPTPSTNTESYRNMISDIRFFVVHLLN